MKMLAGGGAVFVLPKGVTVELGTERIVTFTARWRSRLSVKNLAFILIYNELGISNYVNYNIPPLPKVLRVPLVLKMHEHCELRRGQG